MLAFPATRWDNALLATTVISKSMKGLKPVASLIVPRLYLSDVLTAQDEKELIRLGITHVISVMKTEVDLPSCIPQSNRMQVPVDDCGTEPISMHFDGTTEFIRAALKENHKNKVLVHCFQGISRSATIVCAYLIATERMAAMKSIEFVQSKRGCVSPNNGFRQQLIAYATHFDGTLPKKPGFTERLRFIDQDSDQGPGQRIEEQEREIHACTCSLHGGLRRQLWVTQ